VKAFADLYAALDETTRTSEKVRALSLYFSQAPPEDAAWAVFFLIGRKPRQVVPTAKLRAWAAAEANVPDWLFEESYHAVGDLAETIALLLPAPLASSDRPLSVWVEQHLLPLRGAEEAAQREVMCRAWREMDDRQRFVWNKLITGAFRVGVSQQLVTRALAERAGMDPAVVAHRLMGDWLPSAAFFEGLLAPDASDTDASRLYPFFLAHPLDDNPESLGSLADWQAEWKWDGIRAQLIRRAGETFLWTRGEELVTERYPELAAAGAQLPEGTVIDGEILPWKQGEVLPFAQLQRRIGRKSLGKKLLAEVPVVLMAFDLLEDRGEDVRGRHCSGGGAAWPRSSPGRAGPARSSSRRSCPPVRGRNWSRPARRAVRGRSRG
jgi:DNA ligase-1